jgi:hypothetical protein
MRGRSKLLVRDSGGAFALAGLRPRRALDARRNSQTERDWRRQRSPCWGQRGMPCVETMWWRSAHPKVRRNEAFEAWTVAQCSC